MEDRSQGCLGFIQAPSFPPSLHAGLESSMDSPAAPVRHHPSRTANTASVLQRPSSAALMEVANQRLSTPEAPIRSFAACQSKQNQSLLPYEQGGPIEMERGGATYRVGILHMGIRCSHRSHRRPSNPHRRPVNPQADINEQAVPLLVMIQKV